MLESNALLESNANPGGIAVPGRLSTSLGAMRIHLVKWDAAGALLWDDVNIEGEVRCTAGTAMSYYPYGQEQTSTANDPVKFATYTRDAHSGVDYAMNRYYQSWWGRFTTADPYRASGGPGDPGSWNRYAYVQGDPVNAFDPEGLQLRMVTVRHRVCFYVMGSLDSCELFYDTYWVDDGLGGGGGGGGTGAGTPVDPAGGDGGTEGCDLSQWITMDDCGAGGGLAAVASSNWWTRLGYATWWAAARYVGTAGERVVSEILGLSKNNSFRISVSGSFRIPDFVDPIQKTIYEVKNASAINWIPQLEDVATWAVQNQYTFVLYVNETTTLSPSVLNAQAAGKVIIQRFTWP